MKPVKPVVWVLLGIFSVYLAVAAASAYEEGSNIFVWMGRFSEVLKRPSLLRWTPHTVKCIVVVLLLCAFAVLLYRSDREKRRPGGEYGTAKWETAEVMNQKYADKDGPNVILTQHVSIGMDGYKHQRNLNVLVVGGSGSGKTRYFCKPGLMDANCSYLVVDPKGEMLRSTGHFLKSQGYDIKVFDLIHPRQSDGYNPFRYIREEPDVLKLMDNLVKNTTPPKGASNDPFWEKAEIALDSALMLYLLSEAPKEEQTFEMLMFMLECARVMEEDDQYPTPLDLLFQSLEERDPTHVAVREYKVYKQAAGKTAKSILITAGVRLTAFIFPQYAAIMQEDEMDFGSLGERKRAIFCITPVNDGSMNYLVSMLFTQCFQELYLRADERYDGRLPVPVRVIQDEWANVPQPDSYPKVLATCRSYNIGIDIIVQNIQSIKARYRDEYQSIIGNCDTLLFLGGGNEPESLEFMSKLLGKETISIRTRGQTRGRSGSSSINYQLTGRELMTPDEIRRMPTREALLLIRGESPVRDRKYNIKKHPNYRYTQDGGAKPYIHNPPPAPDYALTDLPYVFRTLDDFRFLEDEYEQEKQEKMENRRRYLRERGAVLVRCYHRLRNRR
jgi:type IV secretion system protein VirD4